MLRELGISHLFRGDLVQAERFVSEALAAYRAAGPRARRRVGAAEPRVDLVHAAATSRTPKNGSSSRPSAFAELGDWGGLGWAYGLLAFVRYNQGRLEEAADARRAHRDRRRARPATAGPSA